jgi:hypothetical protein
MRPTTIALAVLALMALSSLSSCVTVAPQRRAILADPVMQFEGDPHPTAHYLHALENREGSAGGTGVAGGGCGCN